MTELERTQDALTKTRAVAWQACGALLGLSVWVVPLADKDRTRQIADEWMVELAALEQALVESEKQT